MAPKGRLTQHGGKQMKKAMLLLACLLLAVGMTAQTTGGKPSAAHVAQPAAPAPTTDNDSPAAPTATPTVSSLPAGTAIKMKLETAISTSLNKPGDQFSGRVTEPVAWGGKTIIPVGASLEGKVLHVDEPRRVKGTPTIDLRPEVVVLPSGERYTINATVVDTSNRDTRVNDEGQIKGRGHDSGDLKETGIGTGAGALTGGLIGGGKGALIGAGVGATATVVHWLAKHRQAYLPAGTEVVMELSRPMALSASSSGQ